MGTRTLTHVRHHTSHRRLLDRTPRLRGRARIDAIVVPAARHADGLLPALRLAKELDSPLVALCSRSADAGAVRESAARIGVRALAVDVPAETALPRLLTSDMIALTPFVRSSDTALKRNIALALTRMCGWDRVLCLDDDISGLDAQTVAEAAALLPSYGVVGLRNTGYPDNSVVCHANRDTGSAQDTFIGGGAMLFPGSRVTSFFPDIYNEDWFFLLDDDGLADIAVHGNFAQAQFDPYPNPGRAGQEEFGDSLAEGLFALLDDGHPPARADLRHWRAFLAERHRLIETILRRVPAAKASAVRREQMAAALRAARSSLLDIEPELCVAYLEAWRHDRIRWQRYVERLPQDAAWDVAVKTLELR